MNIELYETEVLNTKRELGEVHPVGVLFLTFFLMGIIALALAVLIEVWCKGGLHNKVNNVVENNKRNEEEFTQFKNPMYSGHSQ